MTQSSDGRTSGPYTWADPDGTGTAGPVTTTTPGGPPTPPPVQTPIPAPTPVQAPFQPPAATQPMPAAVPPPVAAGFSGADVPPPPAGPRPAGRRGPGWPGVLAVGVGTALLSSLLTAGFLARDEAAAPVTALPSSTSGQQAPGPVTSSDSQAPDWRAVAGAVGPSVVAIQIGGNPMGGGGGEGSGVILDAEGRVLTNNHVVASAAGGRAPMQVVLSDGRAYDAQVVGTDPATDLAVIKIDNPPSGLRPATLGDSESVRVGDHVMAIGNPLGLQSTVTTGIVSALDRPVTTTAQGSAQGQGEAVITNAIQTDAAINPGNSGGALVDAQGRVIGINSSIATLSGGAFGGQSGSIGLGFAIPVNEAKYVAEQLSKGGTVAHAWLGVTPVDGTVELDGAGREAAVLREIVGSSPAEKAGLRGGDAVIGVDGEPVNGATSLVGQLRQRRPDTAVTLQIVRDGRAQDVKVTLGTRPQNAG